MLAVEVKLVLLACECPLKCAVGLLLCPVVVEWKWEWGADDVVSAQTPCDTCTTPANGAPREREVGRVLAAAEKKMMRFTRSMVKSDVNGAPIRAPQKSRWSTSARWSERRRIIEQTADGGRRGVTHDLSSEATGSAYNGSLQPGTLYRTPDGRSQASFVGQPARKKLTRISGGRICIVTNESDPRVSIEAAHLVPRSTLKDLLTKLEFAFEE
ncbi:hypothetical protein B0H14DRAFT_2617835 [Mycena olivaceomarginata]|nr:hypothetical protein B0H14DRAFT_2617835 [Mycena olivaceomarginata]